MSRSLRELLDNKLYAITNRAIDSQFFIKYDETTKGIAEEWLARAAELFCVDIYGFVFMDNHFHLIVSALIGKNISDFMGYFQNNFTKAINRCRGRTGSIWCERFDSAEILDGDAELERLAYTLLNPVAASMCNKPEKSPVPTSLQMNLRGETKTFHYLDKEAWKNAGGRKTDKKKFQRKAVLKMKTLPCLEEFSPRERRQLIRTTMKEHPSNIFVPKPSSRNFKPTDRPKKTKRSPRVKCHSGCLKLRGEWLDQRKRTIAAYYQAAAEYVKGYVDVLFPPGMFPPSRLPEAHCLE